MKTKQDKMGCSPDLCDLRTHFPGDGHWSNAKKKSSGGWDLLAPGMLAVWPCMGDSSLSELLDVYET